MGEQDGFIERKPVEGNGNDGMIHAPTTETFELPTYSQEVEQDSAREYGSAPGQAVLGAPAQPSETLADLKAHEARQIEAYDRSVLSATPDISPRDLDDTDENKVE
jgi:hypothetical protein